MKKRILSMLLAMAMLLGLMPMSVFAEATEQVVIAEPAEAAEAAAPTEEAEEVSLTAFYVNPLYADQMTEEDLQTAFAQNPPLYAGKAGSSGADYCTTPADAAPVLRQAMEQREAVVTVPYVIPAEVLNAEEGLRNLCIELFEQAFAHTGVPTQGDYLRWHYFSWSVSLRGTWNADNTAVNGELSFAISYHSDAAQEAAVSTRVDALLAELNPTGSDYQKLKTVYDWMCDNITYDYTNLNDPTYKLKFSAYAALINGTAVCQGYANLLYRLALEMGIDCRVIAGTSHGEGHAWNIAKLGGSYYNLDSTWDSSRTTYAYFLKSNANFDDHTRNSEYTTAAFNAAYPMGSSDYDPAAEVPGNVVASGTCGENVTWVLTNDGVLTISGTGAMADYGYGEAPWYVYAERITSAVVETGVTIIGASAFTECRSLTSITIPDGVTRIGQGAFGVCSLTNITLPSSVTSIGLEAFYFCGNLTSITIPDSVTSIGGWAFESCTSLTEITFMCNAPAIGMYAFRNVTATAYYPAGDATWTEEVMQNYGGTITWKEVGTDTPGNVVASGKCGENLTWELTSNGTLTISGTGTMADYDVSEYAPWYDYRGDITSAVVETGVTSIGDWAFSDCSGLTSVTIPLSVISIGGNAFSDCSGLTSITLPDSVTSIGNGVFWGCRSLTSIAIPDSVTSIGDYAFEYCRSLKGIWVSEDNPNYSSDECGVLFDKEKTTLLQCPDGMAGEYNIPDSVTSIGEGAFHACSWLTDITIPNGVKIIGDDAFSDCNRLTNITIPCSVTRIEECAFQACSSLTSITIPNGVSSIGDYAFYWCESLTSVTIPSSVTSIADGAFAACSCLTEITFAGDAPAIGEGAFDGDTATAYYPAGNATWTEEVMQNYGGTITWKAVCIDHQWGEWKVTTEPTCTKPGEETRTCDLCVATETRPVDTLDHNYESAVTAPTCAEKGYTTHTCNRCNHSYVDTYVDALGHKTELRNEKEATCTETGYTGDEICTVCGETVKKGEAIAALGHSFGEWKQTEAPTCTEKGEETHTCTVCGATEKREVAALGHKLALVPAVAPDYAKPGMKAHYVCEVCGKLFADEAGTATVTEEELIIPQLIQVENGKTEIGKEVIDSAAESVENGGEVKLPVADAGEVKSAALPVEALTKVADKEASLTVEMTAATVTMDTAALEAIARQSGEQDAVTLEITEISKEDLTEAQQEAVKDKNVVNTISAQLLVNDQPIASEASGGFGDGRVTVRIPFTPEAGTTAEDYKVLYVAADGTTTEISTTYEDGCLVIVLEHFSDYVIVKTKTVMLGDINGDGKITVTDLMCLANHFAGKAEINEANSDLDGNGKVNVTDLMRLANVFAGKATLG